MTRTLAVLGFTAFSAAALLAQQHGADTDKMMAGGTLPAGWSVRLDSGSNHNLNVHVDGFGVK